MRRYELDTSYQGNMPNEVEFTLDNRYVVKIGDERFYNLMGETMLSAFNGLVHPDDVMVFEQFINSDMSVRYYKEWFIQMDASGKEAYIRSWYRSYG